MLIRGNGTYVRPLTLDDADALLELRLANRAHFQIYEPLLTEQHYTLVAQQEEIDAAARDWEVDRRYVFGIFDGVDDLVGRVSLSAVFRRAWQNANIGYYVDRRKAGRGHATEGVKLCVRFAFETARLHRVQGAVMTWNPPSRRVLEKAGFRLEGIARHYLNINGKWEDHHIYAITVEDWLGPSRD